MDNGAAGDADADGIPVAAPDAEVVVLVAPPDAEEAVVAAPDAEEGVVAAEEGVVAAPDAEEEPVREVSPPPEACADDEAARRQAVLRAAFNDAPADEYPCVECLERRGLLRLLSKSGFTPHYNSWHKKAVMRYEHQKKQCDKCHNWFRDNAARQRHIDMVHRKSGTERCRLVSNYKKFVHTGLLLSHMCSKHPRAVLLRLQSVLDQKLSNEALEADDSLDGITLCQESEQQDMIIIFKEWTDMFKWLFYAPSSGVAAKTFPEMRENKCKKGATLLENIKEKMKTLPTDKSSSEFAKALPEIQESWHSFLKASVLDYREIILALSRSFLWRELKRCMTEDPEVAAKSISAADIDAVFTSEADSAGSTAAEENALEPSHAKKDHVTGDDKEDPNDPQDDCIPPRSISRENHGARLISLACEFHELLNKILMEARDYWNAMSSERRRNSFLRVRLDVLQDEYSKIDRSYAFTMADVQSFVKEHESWRFWVCPICGGKKFVGTGLLLSHMCSKHPRAVIPRLQSILDQKLSDEALEADDSLDGITLCQESEQQDMIIIFKERSDMFKWLFYAPSSGVAAKPFPEMRENKCKKGATLLENIKEKMKTLPPTDTSSSEFAKALPEIQELWHNFLKASVLDYREIILALARSFLWRELKRCMTEDPEVAAKSISAADIDAVFTSEADSAGSTDAEENALEPSDAKKDHVTGDDKESSHADEENLKINLKTSVIHQESEVHVEDQTRATDTESSDPAINMVESGNDLETKLEDLQIDPNSGSSISASEAGSSGQNDQ